MYETILVPTDGSERAGIALDRALDLAAEHDATLHCLCIIDTDRYDEPALSTTELLTTAAEDVAHEQLAVIEAVARERGVEPVLVCRHGVPGEAVLAYAEEVAADLIVMGEQGDTHQFHRGTVARTVLDKARVPVVTV